MYPRALATLPASPEWLIRLTLPHLSLPFRKDPDSGGWGLSGYLMLKEGCAEFPTYSFRELIPISIPLPCVSPGVAGASLVGRH